MGKGLRALYNDNKFFFQEDAFEKLGLGKNMVQSLRHWLIATNAAEIKGVGKERRIELTSFGEWLLEFDPALKYFDTLAIIHYNIVSDIEPSSSWYWYFNLYNETISDKETIFIRLNEWIQEREARIVSENSIKRDVDILLNMYSHGEELDDPEEVIFSPLAKLALIKENNTVWIKNEVFIPRNNLFFIKYALCKYSNKYNQFELGLNEVINEKELLGKVFNMKSSTIIESLVKLENDYDYRIEFTRTNNLDYIKLPQISIDELLDRHKI